MSSRFIRFHIRMDFARLVGCMVTWREVGIMTRWKIGMLAWRYGHLKQNTVKVRFGAGRRIFWPMLIETDRWIEKIENLFIEIL